jgi:hypothetical protein
MNKDRIKLKRLEPNFKRVIKWRREVQEKLETEINLSPAEILNTKKWHDGLKAAKTAIYCLELIYRRRLMDQAAFPEPDSKIQKVGHVNNSHSTKLSNGDQENGELRLTPYIPVPPDKLTLNESKVLVVSNESTLNKLKVTRKRVVKPTLFKEKVNNKP